jgi:hypothetical protein
MKPGWSYNHYSDHYLMTYAFEQLILHLSPRLSAMIYTQLSDVENEVNGIVTYNREYIKLIPRHINRVLTNNFSRLYKLEHIWNLTSIPYTNYTTLSLLESFSLVLDTNSTSKYHWYFYVCYLYSHVNITIDHHHVIILNQTHEMNYYHYISLPTHLFRHSKPQQHFLDIDIHYNPSSSDDDNNDYDDESFVYTNRTYFYLSLAMLSE